MNRQLSGENATFMDRLKAAVNSFGLPRLIIACFLQLLFIAAPFVGADFATQITNTNDRSGAGWSDSTPAHFGNFFQAIRERNPQLCRANAEIAVKSTYLPLAGNVAQLTGELLKVDPATGRLLNAGAAAQNLWGREYAKGWEVA